MKNLRITLSIVTVLILSISCRNPDFLFQENVNNWFIKGDAGWKFSNNELIGTVKNGTGFIVTQKTYSDFVLELEFKPDSTINSGVFIRCNKNDISATDCYEMNIWDLHPNQDNRTGAIVTRSIPLARVETINKWNTYKIMIKKNHILVWVNGVLTADLHDQLFTEGYIALQAAETGEIRFRNIKIRPSTSKTKH